MTNKKKKINVKRCVIALAIFIIIVMLIIFNILKEDTPKELSILMDNEIIELKDKVIIDEEKNIFFSKEDVQEIFDDKMYYNEVEEELITTYNKHVALLKIGEKYTEINDETVELKGTLQKVEEKIYLPITDLEVVYDIEIDYSEKNNRIIIDSIKNKKIESTISQRTNLKSSKGLFSKKIEKLIIGDKIIVLETVRQL